jgi:site-specific DNA-adenine methylase
MDTNLITIVRTLRDKVLELEERVEKLEEENVGMTNELYELQNRQDILQDPRYGHLNEFSLGE